MIRLALCLSAMFCVTCSTVLAQTTRSTPEDRVAALEAENARLRALVGTSTTQPLTSPPATTRATSQASLATRPYQPATTRPRTLVDEACDKVRENFFEH